MNEANLHNGVLQRIDEATSNAVEGIGARYPIAEFLREATAEILRTAPLHTLPKRDFSDAPVTDLGDGTGTVDLPEDFVRLARFRLHGWLRPALSVIATDDPQYARQLNPVTRGGRAKPAVALLRDAGGLKLQWFSLPPGVPGRIREAECVVGLAPTELPDMLADALCWLTASLVLTVANEGEAAGTARNRYELAVSLL